MLALGPAVVGAACSSSSETESVANEPTLSGRYEPGPAGYLSAWFSGGLGGKNEVKLLKDDGTLHRGVYELQGRPASVLRITLDSETTEYRVALGKKLSELGTSESLGTLNLKPQEATAPSSSSRCEPTRESDSEAAEEIGTASLKPSAETTSSSSGAGSSLLQGCSTLLSGLNDVVATASIGTGSAGDSHIKRVGGAPESIAPFDEPDSRNCTNTEAASRDPNNCAVARARRCCCYYERKRDTKKLHCYHWGSDCCGRKR